MRGMKAVVDTGNFGDRFGLGYKPSKDDFDRIAKERREKQLAKLFGRSKVDDRMHVPHIRTTFPFAAETINQESASKPYICAIGEGGPSQSSFNFMKKSEEPLSNWTAVTLSDVSL